MSANRRYALQVQHRHFAAREAAEPPPPPTPVSPPLPQPFIPQSRVQSHGQSFSDYRAARQLDGSEYQQGQRDRQQLQPAASQPSFTLQVIYNDLQLHCVWRSALR